MQTSVLAFTRTGKSTFIKQFMRKIANDSIGGMICFGF